MSQLLYIVNPSLPDGAGMGLDSKLPYDGSNIPIEFRLQAHPETQRCGDPSVQDEFVVAASLDGSPFAIGPDSRIRGSLKIKEQRLVKTTLSLPQDGKPNELLIFNLPGQRHPARLSAPGAAFTLGMRRLDSFPTFDGVVDARCLLYFSALGVAGR